MRSTQFDGLLPEAAIIFETTLSPEYEQGLFPNERRYIQNATPARQREFATGRFCARTALQKLGLGSIEIPVGHHREPLFPDAISGSITHVGTYCAAAVVSKEQACIGIDAEVNAPLDADVTGLILRPEEVQQVIALPKEQGICWERLVFSMKESFFKAYHQMVPEYIDFQDASSVIHAQTCDFYIQIQIDSPLARNWYKGRYRVQNDFIFSAIALTGAA